MLSDNFPPCVSFTLAAEGGFVIDDGGPTNHGITLRTLSAWRRKVCTVQDVRDLTVAEASAIYRASYWRDGLPFGVDLMDFDFGANAGTHESAVILQRAVGFTGDEVDGDIGPETLKAVAAKNDVAGLINRIGPAQAAFYKGLSDFPDYGDGWLARTDRRVAAALAMCGHA